MTRVPVRGSAVGPEQQLRRDAGPQTDRGHARKAELLAAARRVFERQGFLDARVADIADEAGVSQGTFYTYFDSKEAVFQAVAADVATRMIAAMKPSGPRPETVFEQVHQAMRRFVAAYRKEARLIVVIAQLGQSTPEVAGLRLSVREAFVDRTARGIRLQQTQGLADPALDPDLASEVLGSMVDHTCWVWLNLGREFEEEALLETLTLVWTRALGLPAPAVVR
ncbi:TetR/AcrR family transcriptional regulator [Blastococcus sp. SYSU D00669]